MKWLTLMLVSAVVGVTAGARILAILPVPTKSHAHLMDPLVQELLQRGHHVTYLTPFPLKDAGPNIKQIHLAKLVTWVQQQMDSFNTFEIKRFSVILQALMPAVFAPLLNREVLSDEEVKELIASDDHFDLILGEAHIDEALLAGFSHKFKAPFIGLSTFMANPWSNYMVGNPAPAAVVPDPMLRLTSRMTFCQRVANTVWGTMTELVYSVVSLWIQDSIMREFFGPDLPPIKDIVKNASLVLVNHHHSLAFPRPYLPNMVEVGGFHVKPPKELPKDLKKYFDEAKEGVIFFSLGSHVQSSKMAKEKIEALLSAFGQLKQKVLWKFDAELENLPKNVNISKWLPQSDILAHPNLKLFITHGGLLSTTEAVHRGVPVVGIPILGDQPVNMMQVEAAGFGITLEYEDITKESVLAAIDEVMNSPKYREVAKHRSLILRDTIQPPMETAMYWIEYVIRHRGAPHLRSAAQDLAWYQLYLLDVFAVLTLAGLTTLYLEYRVAKCLLGKCFGKKKSKASSVKKTN